MNKGIRRKLPFKSSTRINQDVADIGWLWVLRLYSKKVAIPEDVSKDGLAHMASVLKHNQNNLDKIETSDFLSAVDAALSDFESREPELEGVIGENLYRLSEKFHLSDLEANLLAFRVVLRLHPGLQKMMDSEVSDNWPESLLYTTLAVALDSSEFEIEKALQPEGTLRKSGLLLISNGILHGFDSKLTLLSGLVSAMTRKTNSIDELLSFAITRVAATTLSCADFPHHKRELKTILQHIANAGKNQLKGVNILLYGEPGVGKTEIARAIAWELKLRAYEVALSGGVNLDDDLDFLPKRLRSYTLLQQLLGSLSNGLIIFDEIEDAFPRPGLLDKPGIENKAWINDILESNPVPSIWISNNVWHLEPAFMRRFDIVLEIRSPTRSKRKELLINAFGDLPLTPEWVDKQANDPRLTPATTHRIVKVIRNAGLLSAEEAELYFGHQISERNKALGIRSKGSYPAPRRYRTDLLNTLTDVDALVACLTRAGRGRVLLYGPSGCGKTALAHHLAREADRPLLLKRASDIISMWLGETEKNLSEMFNEAHREDAILLLDEADSFLQNRRGAQQSWELTQVNELLTQMENFSGVFICATNFMEHLDAAAMRRFTFKVKFDYLSKEQAENLLLSSLDTLETALPKDVGKYKMLQQLASLRNLTPGDFSAVCEQFLLLEKKPSVESFLAELVQVSITKEGGRSFNIGFGARA